MPARLQFEALLQRLLQLQQVKTSPAPLVLKLPIFLMWLDKYVQVYIAWFTIANENTL